MDQSLENCTTIVLLNTFLILNKRFRVVLHAGTLIWEKEKNDQQSAIRTTVPIKDVISIDYKLAKIDENQQQPIRFTIHYAAKRKCNSSDNCNKWRKHSVTMSNADFRIIKLWVETIQNAINEQEYRPNRLLLFINPFGGKGQALRIYEKFAKPIFQLAKLDVNVIISQRSNQIQDFIRTHSLIHYDGIVCVGGDGTFSELFNGLIFKEITTLGLDPQKPKYIPKPKIPIGIIPAGSTDTIVYCLHGTSDIQTSVIHIVLGQINGLDLSSVSNHNGLIRMYASIMSYGYLGDVAADSENYRWIGPKRYDYSGFKKFMLNRGYEGEISLYVDKNTNSSPINGPACNEQCVICSNSSITSTVISNEDENNWQHSDHPDEIDAAINYDHNDHDRWKIIKGKFFMINGANISCACARSPNGFSKYCHLGDGCLDLVVIRHTTFLNNLKLLLTLSSKTGHISHLPFVEIYRVKKFIFRASQHSTVQNDLVHLNNSTQPINNSSIFGSTSLNNQVSFSTWNCDGEIVPDLNVTVKSHCQLINVYRRGICSTKNHAETATICGLCKN